MTTIFDPILGDIEFDLPIDRFLVICVNADTNEAREVVVAATARTATESDAERWICEMLGEPWTIRTTIPMTGPLTD